MLLSAMDTFVKLSMNSIIAMLSLLTCSCYHVSLLLELPVHSCVPLLF